MGSIDYDRFIRVLTRCVEVAAEQDLPPIIAQVYQASSQAHIEGFLAAAGEVDRATTAFNKENREGNEALRDLDGPYRVARSAVLAVLKNVKLPDTLKAQPTDTDKLKAIEKLLDLIDDHAGESWADTLLQGDFGVKGAKAVKEMNEAVAANKALNKAQLARATAYGPAYESYLAFKRVVRDALGPGSKQYRRIHLRASPGAAQGDGASAPGNEVPAPASAPVINAGGGVS